MSKAQYGWDGMREEEGQKRRQANEKGMAGLEGNKHFRFHSEDNGKLLGNFKQGRLTCGQALGWTPTCRKLTFLRLRERERSRAGKRQRDVTATDPAGGDGVG